MAPPVLIEFDRILSAAEELLAERPLRTTLEKREIDAIADFFYANQLDADDEERREGGSEAVFQQFARQLSEAGIKANTSFKLADAPKFGLSERDMYKRNETLEAMLPYARAKLAAGDFSFLVNKLLKIFRINWTPLRRPIGNSAWRC